MFRSLIALTTAGAVTLGGLSATPAAADDKDLGKLLAGAAAIFIIAKALDADKDHRAEVKRNRETARFDAYAEAERAALERQLAEERARRGLGANTGFAIPGACTFEVKGSYGREWVAGKDCLTKSYYHAASLPAYCEKSISTRKGPRAVYDLDCLDRWGFPVEAR